MKSTRRCISTALLSLFLMVFSLMSFSSAAHAVAVPEGDVVIRIVNSQGDPIENAKIRYQTSSWYDAGNTDANGEAVVSVPEKFSTITARAYYNGAYFDIRQNIRTNSVIEFKTIRTVVSLKNSTGDPLEGGAVKFVFSSWAEYGVTDINGQSVMELLPGKYTFRMKYEEGQLDIKQDISQNPEVAFSTAKVTVRLEDASGNALEGGKVRYVRASWRDFGITASDGNAVKQLLNGSYTFRMYVGSKYQDKKAEVAGDTLILFTSTETPLKTWTLTTSVSPSQGGSVVVSPAKTTYTDGEKVSFKAVPAQGYSFSGYGGQNGSEIINNILTMNSNKSVSIIFEQINTNEEYKIISSVQPANGGTITITPSKSVYIYGDKVQISANPANGFEFVQLSGTGMDSSSITTLPYNFDITGDVNITAIFKEVGAPETIIVHNITELNQAEITARKGNVLILLDDGEYVLSDQFMVGGDHVTIRSLNGDASKVIVKGCIYMP
ncbi:MAG: hypothetical protein HQK62_08785 [Desulfamplus sp.]|nr:hypothetical protein [Desulfamplus sp.]